MSPATNVIANQTTFVDVAGKKTQVTRGGEGPPLLYLHSAAGETEWLPFHELLAGQFTVYAPAHPGFAASGGLDQIDTAADMAWHYVDLLEQLELDCAPVVGFSLGAWVAAELAILRPQLVEKLVLTAAAGLHVQGSPIADIFIDEMDELRELIFRDANDPAADLIFPAGLDDPKMLFHLRAREASARVGWNPYMHNPNLKHHLRRIQSPTLLIWGEDDQVVPLAHGECYQRHIPQAQLATLKRCGHMAPLEQPEEFARLVAGFCGK